MQYYAVHGQCKCKVGVYTNLAYAAPIAHKRGGGKGKGKGEKECITAHPGCGSRVVPTLYTFHSRPQTNYEVFKWVPSTTALTTDRWLANRELITRTASCLRFCTTAALAHAADRLHSKFRHTE